jgi:hypothetical protein
MNFFKDSSTILFFYFDWVLKEKLILLTKIKFEKNFQKKSIHKKAEKLGY